MTPDFATQMLPLNEIWKDNFRWEKEEQNTFKNIKKWFNCYPTCSVLQLDDRSNRDSRRATRKQKVDISHRTVIPWSLPQRNCHKPNKISPILSERHLQSSLCSLDGNNSCSKSCSHYKLTTILSIISLHQTRIILKQPQEKSRDEL